MKAFEDGYEGSFEDEEGNVIIYDKFSKMLLIDTEIATYPVNLDYKFIKQMFTKRKVTVDNSKVIGLLNESKLLNFEVEVVGEVITGTLEKIYKTPVFSISDNYQLTGFPAEAIVLRALLNGTWTLKQ